MVVSTGVAQLSLVVTGVVAARGLGPVDRGHYAVLTLVPLVLSQAIQMGVPIALTYFLASDRALNGSVRDKALWVMVSQALAAVCLALLGLQVFQAGIDEALLLPALLLIPAVIGLIVQEYAYAVLQGLDHFNHVAVARLFPAVVYALLAAALWFNESVTLVTMSAAWSTAYCLSAILGVAMIWRIGVPGSQAGVRRSVPDLFRFGARAFVGTVAPMDVFRLDQIFGSFLLSPVSLGIYVVSQAFSSIPKIIGANTGHVVYVDTANRMAEDPRQLPALVRKIAKLSALGAIPCAALIAVLPVLNRLFFGAEFADADVPSQILVGAAWISAVRRIVSEFAKGLGKPEVQTIAEIVICFMVGGLALALCPAWGYTGLAAAVALSQAAVLALSIALLTSSITYRKTTQ